MQHERALIVDDCRAILKLLTILAEQAGFDVKCASNTKDAIAVLERDRAFTVVITDLNMPGLDGIGVIEAARRHLGEVPIFLFTSSLDSERQIAARNLGARVIAKPLPLSAMKALFFDGCRSTMGSSPGALIETSLKGETVV